MAFDYTRMRYFCLHYLSNWRYLCYITCNCRTSLRKCIQYQGYTDITGWLIAAVFGWIMINELLSNVVNSPLTAEYGWQGGSNLLQWNMPLLLVALWGFKRGYQSLSYERCRFGSFSLWISSLIHLFVGIEGTAISHNHISCPLQYGYAWISRSSGLSRCIRPIS